MSRYDNFTVTNGVTKCGGIIFHSGAMKRRLYAHFRSYLGAGLADLTSLSPFEYHLT